MLRSIQIFVLATLITLTNSSLLKAQEAVPYQNGPVHEAFIPPVTGSIVLQAVAAVPPAPITEQIPPKCSPQATWIPGYWSWVHNLQDFIWVSGVWRVPPPGHQWIAGSWQQTASGWVWVRGFWSPVPASSLIYISKRPPETIHENVPPSPGTNYFWMRGYWQFDSASKIYSWLNGQWAQLNPNWVYVPAHYVWQTQGYVFIPAYWDLPLEQIGCAYSAVTIAPEIRATIIYTPTVILEPAAVIQWIFWYYPDYTWFFWHHWFFHADFWNNWCCVPPWWAWNDCWCFDWHDSWWLWWWWTHPGFANPPWMLAMMAEHMPPPPEELINQMNAVIPPPIVLPWGVVTPDSLLDAIQNITGDHQPIVPADPSTKDKIDGSLKPQNPSDQAPITPSGPAGGSPPPQYPQITPPANVPQGGPIIVPEFPAAPQQGQDNGQAPETPPINPPLPPPPSVDQGDDNDDNDDDNDDSDDNGNDNSNDDGNYYPQGNGGAVIVPPVVRYPPRDWDHDHPGNRPNWPRNPPDGHKPSYPRTPPTEGRVTPPSADQPRYPSTPNWNDPDQPEKPRDSGRTYPQGSQVAPGRYPPVGSWNDGTQRIEKPMRQQQTPTIRWNGQQGNQFRSQGQDFHRSGGEQMHRSAPRDNDRKR